MSGNTSDKYESPQRTDTGKDDEDDDEPDEWDKRIFSTGCAAENTKLNDCFFDKKDWRACKDEMEAFRECWKRQGNDARTSTKDVDINK